MLANLFIHNLGYVVSSVVMFSLGVFVLIKDFKNPANQTLALALFGVTTFTVSHVVGVNVHDHHLSRVILMFNLCNLFMSVFFANCVFIVIGKFEEQRKVLIGLYILSFVLLCVYILKPDWFLLDSVSKMYFPNYYVPGKYEWIMRIIYNGLVPIYFLYHMAKAYRTADPLMKNRLKYLFIGLGFGYAFGSLAIPLVYNIHVDPAWSSFFGLIFGIPFTYGVVKYDLMDIRIVAKQAFTYSILVFVISIFIILLDVSNSYVLRNLPWFPFWAFPLLSSLLAVSVGIAVWRKLRETDLLKYEFITVATHKFQYPLNQIEKSIATIDPLLPPEARAGIEQIKYSTTELLELTTLLTSLANTSEANYAYKFVRLDINTIIQKLLLKNYEERARAKHIELIHTIAPTSPVPADETKITFVIQILLENAITYTPDGGKIFVSVTQDEKFATIKVSDNGIGMNKDELMHVTSTFYRSYTARQIDREGMGISLSMVRQIVANHGGTLFIESAGHGKGSNFSFTLPLER
jgi:signal transduction histidine kinase